MLLDDYEVNWVWDDLLNWWKMIKKRMEPAFQPVASYETESMALHAYCESGMSNTCWGVVEYPWLQYCFADIN